MLLNHFRKFSSPRTLTSVALFGLPVLFSPLAFAMSAKETRLVEKVAEEIVKTGKWPGAEISQKHSWTPQLNYIVRRPELDSYLVKRIQSRLDAGATRNSDVIIPRAVVLTHQVPDMQNQTAKVLSADSRYDGIPRIAMVSEHFTIKDKDYADQISHYRYSRFGEVREPLLAREVYLAGGFDSLCLAQTTRDLIKHAAGKGMPEITLRFQWQNIYYADIAHFGMADNLQKIMSSKQGLSESESESARIVTRTVLGQIATEFESGSLRELKDQTRGLSMNFKTTSLPNPIRIRVVIEDSVALPGITEHSATPLQTAR